MEVLCFIFIEIILLEVNGDNILVDPVCSWLNFIPNIIEIRLSHCQTVMV